MEIRTYFLNEETGNYDEHSSSVSLSEFSYIVHRKAGILDSEVVSEYSVLENQDFVIQLCDPYLTIIRQKKWIIGTD